MKPARGCCAYAKNERQGGKIAKRPRFGPVQEAQSTSWLQHLPPALTKSKSNSSSNPEPPPPPRDSHSWRRRMWEEEADLRGISTFFFSRPAGQGASGLQEEQEGGEQGCGCVAGGSDTHQHNTRLANYFLWAFRKLTARPLQGFAGHTHTSSATSDCCYY